VLVLGLLLRSGRVPAGYVEASGLVGGALGLAFFDDIAPATAGQAGREPLVIGERRDPKRSVPDKGRRDGDYSQPATPRRNQTRGAEDARIKAEKNGNSDDP
jgi:hypothetical protein